MILPNIHLDELTKKILSLIPQSQEIKDDIEQKIKLILQASIAKLDIVTREEFDVQTQVLAKTRQKLDKLEKQIQQLTENKNHS